MKSYFGDHSTDNSKRHLGHDRFDSKKKYEPKSKRKYRIAREKQKVYKNNIKAFRSILSTIYSEIDELIKYNEFIKLEHEAYLEEQKNIQKKIADDNHKKIKLSKKRARKNLKKMKKQEEKYGKENIQKNTMEHWEKNTKLN